MQALSVPARAAGERLDIFVAGATAFTRSRAQSLIKAGAVHVNNATQPARYLVQTGDQITVSSLGPAQVETPPAPQLPILYEDTDVIIIDKPAGLTVHAGAGTSGIATVADFAREHTSDPDPERPGIVHRLDRDTSGILVIAKHLEAKTFLQAALKAREFKKTYTALVVGRPKPDSATIDLPLGRDSANPLRQAVLAAGRPSTTSYQLVAAFAGYSLLTLTPHTGRTHQIRVHMAAIGHAIAGDILYGNSARPLGLNRHFLHASQLELTLPSGKIVKIESPLPPDLAKYLSKLENSV